MRKSEPGVTDWGWQDQNYPSGVLWIPGTLAESYARVTIKPGRWILVSANPVSEYHRVMAETAEANKEGKS